MECGALGAVVPGHWISGNVADDAAQLGSVVGVRMAPRRGWRGRSQLRIGVGTPRRGKQEKLHRVQAVASAYPPIAQTEKTFRLPIDYYQVRFCANWVFPNTLFHRVAEFVLGTSRPIFHSRILGHSWETRLDSAPCSKPQRLILK